MLAEGDTAPPKWRSFLGALLVGSSGMTFAATSVWATNFAAISYPLRLAQLVTVEVLACGAILAIVARRAGNLTVAALSLSVGGLLFGSGDALFRRFGPSGAWALFVLVVTACSVLMHRVAKTNSNALGALALWLTLFFFLQPPLTIVFDREISESSIALLSTVPVAQSGLAEDFFLVVLDGYASFATLRKEFSHEGPIRDILTGKGFETADSVWSPSTWSLVSISSLVDLRVPLTDSEDLTVADSAVLYDMISGNGRLFSMFREAGFKLTYVESGWVGSVCGDAADTCIRRPLFDEAIQTIVDKSLLGGLVDSWWGGHAFPLAGLRSLSIVDRMLRELGSDGNNDMVFAHVMLPHGPYVLGSDCQMTGTRVRDPLDELTVRAQGDRVRAAYLEQMGCVDRWLTDIAAHVPATTAIVITGDHGTLFRGQMLRESAAWTTDEIAERTQTFLATKLPVSCGPNGILTSSLEALMDASDCLLGTRLDRTSAETLWLLGEGVTPRCIKKPQDPIAIIDVPC